MSKTHALFCAVAAALVALPAAHAAEPRIVTYPAGVNTPVAITLLMRDGKVGRDNPFYDNYRPQVQFSAEPGQVTCAVRVPQALDKVEPGQSADVALNCTEKFKVREGDKAFTMFEGGRKVATGTLK